MLKFQHIALLACLAAPLAMAAERDAGHQEGGRHMGPPPGAAEACEGKSAGDKASLSGPDGKTFSGVCREKDGKLVLVPEHGSREGGERGEHEGRRMGPPPGAAKACEGKDEGDEVSLSGPDGKSHSAVCREKDGKLMAMPERD